MCALAARMHGVSSKDRPVYDKTRRRADYAEPETVFLVVDQ